MNPNESALVTAQGPGMTVARFREASDVASVCKEIVTKTAVDIGGRKYVRVEGWTSIAVAHGCIATIKPDSVVEVLRDGKLLGIKAVGQVRRQSDGAVISEAEGFVGIDEPRWYGSNGEKVVRYNKFKRAEEEVVIPKALDHAIRSMTQTRAVSKVCRNAFSHVVVLMEAGLSTTPYEEVSDPADDDGDWKPSTGTVVKPGSEKRTEPSGDDLPHMASEPTGKPEKPKTGEVPRDADVGLKKQFADGAWKKVKVSFGSNKDKALGDLQNNQIKWYAGIGEGGWSGQYKDRPPTEDEKILRAASQQAAAELGIEG